MAFYTGFRAELYTLALSSQAFDLITMCYCGNMEVERTPNRSQHTKLTLEKEILPTLLPGVELATFRSRVRRSYQQAIPAPPM